MYSFRLTDLLAVNTLGHRFSHWLVLYPLKSHLGGVIIAYVELLPYSVSSGPCFYQTDVT